MTQEFERTILRMVRRVKMRTDSKVPLVSIEEWSLRKSLAYARELERLAAFHGVYPDGSMKSPEIIAEAMATAVE